MKTLFLILSLGFFQAQANISGKEIASLPAIQNVKVEVVAGPSFAAVQPEGVISFDYASCATMSFSADVQEEDFVYIVKLKLDSEIDCQAMAVKRPYRVQYTSDASLRDRVVILNPIVTSRHISTP